MTTDIMPKEKCLRCGHEWVKRVNKPKVCPKCQSAYWDVPRLSKDKGTL